MPPREYYPEPVGAPYCRCKPPQDAPLKFKVKKDGPNHGK
jgi:hypothetical protein